MDLINHLNSTFTDLKKLNYDFVGTPPFPMITLDNFLPENMAKAMESECDNVPEHRWKEFTRKQSYMKELTDLSIAPEAQNFTNQMHSQAGMNWLIKLTGIKDLIPDPYIVGAGYSKSYKDCKLSVHTDFNWNDTIKVHRMLSMIIYLRTDWQEEWGGHLHFNDFNNKGPIQKVTPLFNRVVIWRHHERGFHGFPDPLNCPHNITRNTFRLFFYVSNAKHADENLPHRSLYWFDEHTNQPYDITVEK
jgi:hypothetical protein